jgi:hypothetical protein
MRVEKRECIASFLSVRAALRQSTNRGAVQANIAVMLDVAFHQVERLDVGAFYVPNQSQGES